MLERALKNGSEASAAKCNQLDIRQYYDVVAEFLLEVSVIVVGTYHMILGK